MVFYWLLGENVSAGSSVSEEDDEDEQTNKNIVSAKGEPEGVIGRVSRSSRLASSSITPTESNKS